VSADNKYATPQEEFWAGEFGTEYISRNKGPALLAANLKFFSVALERAGPIESCLELGANIGMNLRALKLLYPSLDARGVEINSEAASELRAFIGDANVFEGSILEHPPAPPVDLTLIKGVLIHMNPDALPQVYEQLYTNSKRWILVCEYYNPSPVVISYRGHSDRLFKRDFAGEMLDLYPDLALVDYGFAYRRDPAFPQDDITWFLLKKGR
jgi:pseudaminic acid biosynthesis-associated methylase